jgi:hypothetical protein
VVLAPSRLGKAFALTLALPAVFAGTWVWLAHGGAIERALASERATAEQCLATASQLLQQELGAAAAQVGFALELGPDRRVTGPFPAPARRADALPTIGIASRRPERASRGAIATELCRTSSMRQPTAASRQTARSPTPT